MKNENYIMIQGWMINELNLSGNELLAYAILYGFSQDGDSEFTGSLKYLEKSLSCSRPTIIKILSNLCDKNLIIKRQEIINNVIFNRYKISLQVVNNFNEGSKETLQGGSKDFLQGGSKETLPNNNILDNTNNYNTNNNKKESNKLDSKKEFFESDFFLLSFENLWISYGRKGSKSKALIEAKKLNEVDLKNFLESEDHILAYVENTKEEPKFRKDFERYISNKYWESDIFKSQKVGKIGKTMQLYNNLINKDF